MARRDDRQDHGRTARAQAEHAWLQCCGEKVRARREACGYGQRTLAEAVGVSPKTISAFELGRYWVKMTTLIRIAQALHVQPAALFPFLPGASRS